MSLSSCRVAPRESQNGFTLLELAIAMAVIGLPTVSVVGLYATIAKKQREVKTREEMESIRGAVLGHYQNYLLLPSPDPG